MASSSNAVGDGFGLPATLLFYTTLMLASVMKLVCLTGFCRKVQKAKNEYIVTKLI